MRYLPKLLFFPHTVITYDVLKYYEFFVKRHVHYNESFYTTSWVDYNTNVLHEDTLDTTDAIFTRQKGWPNTQLLEHYDLTGITEDQHHSKAHPLFVVTNPTLSDIESNGPNYTSELLAYASSIGMDLSRVQHFGEFTDTSDILDVVTTNFIGADTTITPEDIDSPLSLKVHEYPVTAAFNTFIYNTDVQAPRGDLSTYGFTIGEPTLVDGTLAFSEENTVAQLLVSHQVNQGQCMEMKGATIVASTTAVKNGVLRITKGGQTDIKFRDNLGNAAAREDCLWHFVTFNLSKYLKIKTYYVGYALKMEFYLYNHTTKAYEFMKNLNYFSTDGIMYGSNGSSLKRVSPYFQIEPIPGEDQYHWRITYENCLQYPHLLWFESMDIGYDGGTVNNDATNGGFITLLVLSSEDFNMDDLGAYTL